MPRLGEYVGVREEVIKKACSMGNEANKTPQQPFLKDKIKNSSEVIFALSGSWSLNDLYANNGDPFGATKIDLDLFPSMKYIGLDEAATVNEAFMTRFKSVITNQKLRFREEVEKAVKKEKQVVFTGNSTGGPIAILVTIWFLEEYRRNPIGKAPICLTFGSPLVGDRFISHALRREQWSHYFTHFVMRYDIVPRVLLAPLPSVQSQLGLVLNYFTQKSQFSARGSTAAIPLDKDLYITVLRNAASVASFVACKMMGNTNPLADTLSSIFSFSPYRPSGTYVFCTGNGKLVVVRNPDAILQILFYSLQLSAESELENVVRASVSHHLNYGQVLDECLGMQSVTYLEDGQLEAIPLTSNTNNECATILNDLGLSVKARLCLRAAAEVEKQKLRNQTTLDGKRKNIESGLSTLQNNYKRTCAIHNLGYYEAFKKSDRKEDFDANVTRLELAGLWDEMLEMLKRYELPDGFERREDWIRLGTEYRRLVEPLDIANYYRHLKNEDTGSYMKRGRPKRYKCTQRWREHFLRKPTGSLEVESCVWAELEELFNIRGTVGFGDRFWNLENRIRKSIADKDLSEDVLNDSTYRNLTNPVR